MNRPLEFQTHQGPGIGTALDYFEAGLLINGQRPGIDERSRKPAAVFRQGCRIGLDQLYPSLLDKSKGRFEHLPRQALSAIVPVDKETINTPNPFGVVPLISPDRFQAGKISPGAI